MTDDVLAFVTHALDGRRRILEVGCGRGELARRLAGAGAGADVTALDLALPDPRPTPGVTWVERDFLDHDDAPYSAILFTSSLHHIHDLGRAVATAARLLAVGGVVIVDDFDLAAPDATTAAWHYDTQELLAAAGLYPRDHLHGDPATDPLTRWHQEHAHTPPLHTGATLLAALSTRFTLQPTRGPYLYRYVSANLPTDPRRTALATHLRTAEERRIQQRTLRPVGLRILAHPTPRTSP